VFANGAATAAMSYAFGSLAQREQDEGRPLTAEERSPYEDFFPSEVLDSARIFEDKVPWWLRKDMDGITLGNRIYFREGVYDPGTAAGVELLGHELVHVEQYAEGMTILRYLWASRKGYWNNPYEKQAYDKASLIRDSFCLANPLTVGC